MSRTHFLVLILMLSLINACSTLKQNDPNEKIHAFVDQFKTNLSASDEVIKKQFQLSSVSNATEEGIMRVISIMQNRNQAEDSVVCTVNFENSVITHEEGLIRVEFTALLASTDPANITQKESRFSLLLSSHDNQFFISDIDATFFYNDYHSTVSKLDHLQHRERDLASKKIFFEQAKALQQKYDTVIWYTQYHDSIYYYVVNGEWSNYFIDNSPRSASAKMGLVSESGRVIVPPAYDLVGTISFEVDDVIEVKKDNRVGHFTLAGKEIIPALYDWIIPYQSTGIYALVKQDSVYGWIDEAYTHHAGFPSADAKKYIYEFAYLSENIKINNTTTNTSEIISPDHMGSGLVMPSAHFVKAKVLDEIISGIYIGESSLGWGGTESVETEGTFFEKVSNKFSALMVRLNDHYLEGREGFYQRTNVSFVDENHELIGSYTFSSGTLTFNKIDSTLMEVRIVKGSDYEEDSYMMEEEDEWYVPYYQYFGLNNGTITKLESHRGYAFTSFVKIDSSYLEGTFRTWDEESNELKVSDFPFNTMLISMRNEILADHGYDFKDFETHKSFSHYEWYAARYSNYEDFYDKMTEVDRHNLDFLEKIIGTLRTAS